MNFLPENLKLLRKRKGITQQGLADALFLNRPVIGAYEEGRAEPKLETLQKLGELFKVPIEYLVSESLVDWLEGKIPNSINPDLKIKIHEPTLKILSITIDSENKENIEWVPAKASAGYLNGYSDPEYMSQLDKFQLPMLKDGTYRAFEIKGDSMLPLTSGTFIIGEFIEDWKYIRDGDTYIIISKDEGIVYKRAYKIGPEKCLNLVSDNPEYEPYQIPIHDILEIWKSKAFISTQIPKPNTQQSIEEISEMLVKIQKSVDHLKK